MTATPTRRSPDRDLDVGPVEDAQGEIRRGEEEVEAQRAGHGGEQARGPEAGRGGAHHEQDEEECCGGLLDSPGVQAEHGTQQQRGGRGQSQHEPSMALEQTIGGHASIQASPGRSWSRPDAALTGLDAILTGQHGVETPISRRSMLPGSCPGA